MSAHTPGPWFVENPQTGAVYGPERMVASVYGDDPECKRDARQDANCRLISAAPDLLAALRDIVDVVALCGEPGNVYEVCQKGDFSAARAAIAKADGQS